jgi:hypothetical protein
LLLKPELDDDYLFLILLQSNGDSSLLGGIGATEASFLQASALNHSFLALWAVDQHPEIAGESLPEDGLCSQIPLVRYLKSYDSNHLDNNSELPTVRNREACRDRQD